MANPFLSFLGDDEFKKTIDKFSEVIKTKKVIDKSSNYSSQLIKQALEQTLASNSTEKEEINFLFQNLQFSENRRFRYSLYQELYDSVQLIKRIIKIYLNNVLQRDTVTNLILSINPTEEARDTGKANDYRIFCNTVIDFFNLEYRIHRSVLEVLKLGDAFIEIIDLDKIEFKKPINKNVSTEFITEDYTFFKLFKTKNNHIKLSDIDYENIVDYFFEFENDNQYSDILIQERKKEESPYNLSRILLKFHKPENIFILHTEFDNILGYVEIAEDQNFNYLSRGKNPILNFAKVINQISLADTGEINVQDEKTYQQTLLRFVDIIVSKLVAKYKIEEFGPQVKNKLGQELYNIIKRLYLSSSTEVLFKNKLRIRYIPPYNMIHLSNPGGEYYPYGTSIIDNLVFPAKLYLLNQIANVINKLSRSSVLRKWSIETGDHENINALVQRLNRQIRNQHITVNDIAYSKNLPNILSDYRDVFTFKKRGQTFIDVEPLNTGDPNIRVQDLEDIRRELIALSGIPSMYLGYNDMDMREQIASANAVFADDISYIQKHLNDALTNLIARIAEIVEFSSFEEFKKNVRVGLKPPTTLLLQQFESSLNSISNLQRAFNEMPEIVVDPYYLLRRFIPFIDWDQFKVESTDFLQKKKVSKEAGIDDGTSTYGGAY